jgi:glycosyltransferase involved in cell wall biosynthesis
MKLLDITPMILTFNEQDNLRVTLQGLSWAHDILLVDSYSTDQTHEIAAEFPNVRIVYRKFDHFADQCNFGLTQVQTPWVLSLDADYKCNEQFAAELADLKPEMAGYRARFKYGIYGKSLRSTLYPPRVVLYQVASGHYERDGHAHRVKINGSVGELETCILHDDWKPLTSWLASQIRYANHEADKLAGLAPAELGWKDWVRKKILLAAPLTFMYCLLYKRLVLDGWRGVYYTLQRTFAELTLSLILLDRKIRNRASSE